MALTALGLGLAGAATLGGGIANAIGSYQAGKRTAQAGEYASDQSYKAAVYAADKQEAINQANIEFQQRENEITRGREDTAHQREVADLMNAGLSPLASTSGAQAAALSAPQMDSSGYSTAADLMASGAQTSADYMSKAAQLRYGSLSQFAGSVSSALNQMVNLRSQFINDSNTSAQTAYTQALADEKNISNSFLADKYVLDLHNLAQSLRFSKAHQALIEQQKEESKSHQSVYNTDAEKQSIWNERLADFIDSEVERNFSSRNVNNATSFKIYGEEDRHKQAFDQLRDLNIPFGTSLSLNLGGPFNVYGAAKQLAFDGYAGFSNLGSEIQRKIVEYAEAIENKQEFEKGLDEKLEQMYKDNKYDSVDSDAIRKSAKRRRFGK